MYQVVSTCVEQPEHLVSNRLFLFLKFQYLICIQWRNVIRKWQSNWNVIEWLRANTKKSSFVCESLKREGSHNFLATKLYKLCSKLCTFCVSFPNTSEWNYISFKRMTEPQKYFLILEFLYYSCHRYWITHCWKLLHCTYRSSRLYFYVICFHKDI